MGSASVNIGDTVSKPIPHVEATVEDCATMRETTSPRERVFKVR